MALSSAFQERLEEMEHTRIQRLSLLQEERELQASKYQTLVSKRSCVRSIEQRCLSLHQKIASQNCRISFLKSEIEDLEYEHNNNLKKLRDLKSEVEELGMLDKEKQRFYELKGLEMKEFKENAERFLVESRTQVDDFRKSLSELQSTFMELQGNNGVFSYPEITSAEARKAELLAAKENLAKALASNRQLKLQLQKQVQDSLDVQNQERRQ